MFTTKNLLMVQHLVDYAPYQFICPFKGFASELEPRSGVKIDTFIMVQERRDMWFYLNLAEWRRVGKQYFDRVRRRPAEGLRVIEEIIRYAQKLYDWCAAFPSETKLQTLTDRQLYRLYDTFHCYHHRYWSQAMVPNLLEMQNSYVIDYVMALLERKRHLLNTTLPTFEILNTVLYSADTSWIKKKEAPYCRLLLAMRRNPVKRQLLITRFYRKYAWLEYNWAGPLPEREALEKQISNDLRSKKDPAVQLRVLQDERRQQLRLKKRFLSALRLSPLERAMIKLLERLYFSKGFRMDCSYYAYWRVEPVLREIGRRLHLSLTQVRNILPHEMEAHLVRHTVDEQRLNDRHALSVYVWDGKTERILTGSDAATFRRRIKEKDYLKGTRPRQLTGQVAFRGTATGTVKIIQHRTDLNKFKRGDILVSGYTDPTLMPAITQAAAIVTDFGGMTCHAAIVSRELKIPCVIGTKVATKVFKDGDRVEINADRGIVKKV